jgi:hypothetical protein
MLQFGGNTLIKEDCPRMAQDKDFTRRDVLKTAGAVTAVAAVVQGAPAIRTAKAAGDPV